MEVRWEGGERWWDDLGNMLELQCARACPHDRETSVATVSVSISVMVLHFLLPFVFQRRAMVLFIRSGLLVAAMTALLWSRHAADGVGVGPSPFGPAPAHPLPDCFTPDNTPWPRPAHSTNGTQTATLDLKALTVSVSWPPTGAPAASKALLARAVNRTLGLVANSSVLEPGGTGDGGSPAARLQSFLLTITNGTGTLNDATDESYQLSISVAAGVVVRASNVFGAVQALNSLQQMVERREEPVGADITASSTPVTVLQIRGLPWEIVDKPRFSHRGVLVDTARHFLPLPTLYQFVDAMPMSKLNVLHLHLVDSQSFPFASESTKLGIGAYSPRQVYTPKQLRSLVGFARDRGVRIVVEVVRTVIHIQQQGGSRVFLTRLSVAVGSFKGQTSPPQMAHVCSLVQDTPGHVGSWAKGYPDIVTPCSAPTRGYSNPPIDPSSNRTSVQSL